MMRSPFKEKSRQTCYFKKPGKWAAGYHTGEDYVCDTDRTLVSPCDGVVIASGWADGYGNRIIIRTKDNKVLLMAHMKEKPILPQGASVKAGQAVGIMGASGGNWGAHLHIEVQNSRTWKYNRNLLKPSVYIDFNKFETEDEEMTQAQFNEMFAKAYSKENPLYKTFEDVPAWGKPAVEYYIKSGRLAGTDTGLNLRNDVLRGLVIACPLIYNTVGECPPYSQPTIQKAVDEGIIVGDEKGNLGLTPETVRILCFEKRREELK